VELRGFPSSHVGNAIRYGLYDIGVDTGFAKLWATTRVPASSRLPPATVVATRSRVSTLVLGDLLIHYAFGRPLGGPAAPELAVRTLCA
jgi:hypothetical protein